MNVKDEESQVEPEQDADCYVCFVTDLGETLESELEPAPEPDNVSKVRHRFNSDSK